MPSEVRANVAFGDRPHRPGVNTKVDTLLRLVSIPDCDAEPGSFRRIRVLQRGSLERVRRGIPLECELIKELRSWERGNPGEYLEIVEGLRRIAKHKTVAFGAGVKPCRGAPGIIEVKAGKRRLYCFIDAANNETVVAAISQSVNTGNKSAHQRAAIQSAFALLQEWKRAIPYPPESDVRVVVR